jgi:hypothetical protein
MPKQLSLLSNPDLKITPEPNRKEPRFWVRRLVIWKDPTTIIRDIPLRPGLNIIWSPDPADQPEKGDSADLGHGSGKTLFCRLLRYCLGEDRFADDNQRHRIAAAFEHGMVGAEIIVEGTPWAVLRPIGRERRHFALRDKNLDDVVWGDLQATGVEPFLDEVESIILTKPVADLIRGGDPAMPWLLSLAWLTRDQECRFDDVLDWRSASSDSESPARALSMHQRLAALRALIGAIVPGELSVHKEIEQLIRRRETAERESERREWDVRRLRAKLITETRVAEQDVPDGPLGVEVLRSAAKRRLAQVAGLEQGADVANVDSLRSALEDVRNRSTALGLTVRELETRIPNTQKYLQRLESELPGSAAEADSAQNPICPVCEVPIDHALAEGCKLSLHLPDFDKLRARLENLQQDFAKERAILTSDQATLAHVRQELDSTLHEVDEHRETLRVAEDARERHADGWFNARRLIDDADRFGELLGDDAQAHVNWRDLELEIGTKREQLAAFRDAQAQIFRNLTSFFDHIVRSLVYGAKGEITLDGNGIHTSVELGGDRSTVAMQSLKVVAFDLAVMCMSIEGTIRLPAFLAHDSPREADLGPTIYDRLFKLVQSLETDHTPPLFQYIITTTTAPPEELRTSPWLVQTLRGMPSEERLVRQDL